MINVIRIFPDRHLIPDYDCLGVVNEYNAERLKLIRPPDINGLDIDELVTRAVFVTADGSYIRTPNDDGIITVDEDLTTGTEITLTVQFLKDGQIKWSSFPLPLHLREAPDDSGEHTQTAHDALTYCTQALMTALTDSVGEDDYSVMSYDELVGRLPVLRRDIGQVVMNVTCDPDNIYWKDYAKISECISYLNTFSADTLNALKRNLTEEYRIAKGLSYSEAESDPLYEQLINSAVVDYVDINSMIHQICQSLFAEGGADKINALIQLVADSYGNTENTWEATVSHLRVLAAIIVGTVGDIYGHKNDLGDSPITNVNEAVNVIRMILPTLRATAERITGDPVNGDLSFFELCDGLEGKVQLAEAMYSLAMEGAEL